jgi:signal transduction histidine kinase/DNA-binding response OmpR family regulator/HAMP domain-containing protein
MVDQLNAFTSEVTRVAREVGTEGNLGGQARVPGVAGTWKDLTDNVNSMAANLTSQVRNIADVTTAVARGDLSKKITVDVKGEISELKDTINTMVDQLNAFASEVTRVAREVGTEGKLGGQAEVRGVGGTWKDLTDNVNLMAANLTAQVRGIAKVVTAVANGDLKRKLALEVKGEIATLADTINEMIDTLATFADQVTTVAREVGFEGKLGGQAKVPGAAGTWRDLTDNVNQLAANLTNQVRAIAEVATAVTKGDLTRSIAVEALGEVAELKDNINQMIANLRNTTLKNTEQDWLKTNLAKFTRMLQGQRGLETVSQLLLSEMAPLVEAQHGVFYIAEEGADGMTLKLLSSFAHKPRTQVPTQFKPGEGLIGQCALEKKRILLRDVPGDYVRISSGLGESAPLNIVVQPVLFEGEVKAVFELASFHPLNENHLSFLEQLTESIGIVFNTIAAMMRTEALLDQSQSLTQKLQTQQEELQKTNEELAEKARLLAEQKAEVERKNGEVEQARLALEEKAEQLALTSKYKSQFLANMSHELRTPLNSLLILSKILSENSEGNLVPKQVEFASTIHSSGADLLELINDILDLSKIESGTMAVDVGIVSFAELKGFVERTFRQVAEARKLAFDIHLDPALPPVFKTDSKRLQQVLKNLLSNAFKFTERGHVSLRIEAVEAKSGDAADGHEPMIAFTVQDTGIGIPKEKHHIIFEAFQQADGTTSRKYGGTGLGLSITREISRILGGRIRLESRPDEGSTFTLYLPLTYQPAGNAAAGGDVGVLETQTTTDVAEKPEAPEEFLPLTDSSDVEDDRLSLRPGERVVLIVGGDEAFSRTLLEIAREEGFKGVVACQVEKAGGMIKEFRPAVVAVDMDTTGPEGWLLLDNLKHNPATRHIPVQIFSGKEVSQRAVMFGAFSSLQKGSARDVIGGGFARVREFLDRQVRKLLVVEDDLVQRRSVEELLGGAGVQISSVGSGEEALAVLKDERIDCLVLDLGLSGMTGFQLMSRITKDPSLRGLPIIVYTGKELSRADEAELKKMAQAVVLKDARSPERLLSEVAQCLHLRHSDLPESKWRIVDHGHGDPVLESRRVLIIDDDVRNIFALSTVLERCHMQVVYAESGKEGIELLESTPGIDIVLMDVMMPEMDGYEAMRSIRRNERLKDLPIIAVTAKAMKGDRKKCLEAGASDYITKPVDVDRLLSLLRVWVYDKEKV